MEVGESLQPELYDTNEQNSDPVTVNIVVNDPQFAQYMDKIAVNVLYFCTQCGHACRTMPDLVDHIRVCFQINLIDIDAQMNKLLTLLNGNEFLKTSDHHQDVSENDDFKRREEGNDTQEMSQNVNEIPETRTMVNKESGVERGSDVDEFEFHDDVTSDPDYMSSTKNNCESLAKKTAEQNKDKGTGGMEEKNIKQFMERYEQFVAENVDQMFKHNLKNSNKEKVIVNASELKPVVEPCTNFDFTLDIKSVFCVPGLEKSQLLPQWNCVDCPDTEFLSEKDFELHAKCHTDKPGKFKCCMCVRRSTVRSHVTTWPTMRTHLSSAHFVDFSLPCKYCISLFSSVQKLVSHCKKVHKLKCDYLEFGCKFSTFDPAEMRLHEKCHSEDDTSLKCPECGLRPKKGKKYQDVRQHIEKEHQNLLQPRYNCPGCADGFNSEDQYKKHYFRCGKVKHLYHKCMLCVAERSVTIAGLHDHLTMHMKSKIVQSKVRRALEMLNAGKDMLEIYNCLCINADPTNSHLKLSPGETKSENFKCKFCYKKLKNEVSFERHMLKSHPEGHDQTICQLCGKLFRTKNQYRNHYKSVHNGFKRPYVYRPKQQSKKKDKALLKCEHCDYTSPYLTRVRNHTMSVHMGVFPYKCTKCSYGTNEVSDLRRHLNKHEGIKRYVCAHCDYKAAYYWLLVTHCKRQHDVEIPKKRKPFNFMGSEGSLRWQRRREKERDLEQRKSTKTTAGLIQGTTAVESIPVQPDKTTNLNLQGQEIGTEIQELNHNGNLEIISEQSSQIQGFVEQANTQPGNVSMETGHLEQGKIIYITQGHTGQEIHVNEGETYYLIVDQQNS